MDSMLPAIVFTYLRAFPKANATYIIEKLKKDYPEYTEEKIRKAVKEIARRLYPEDKRFRS